MKSILAIVFAISLLTTVKAQQTERLVVHFDFDRSQLRSDARQQLDSLLASNKNRFSFTSIEISAHCDSFGNHQYNDALSRQRAETVKNYLVSTGISEEIFIKLAAHGKRQPLNDNASAEERFQNRRVELIIAKSEFVPDPVSPPARTITEVITDTATKVGSTIILKNLNFEGGRHILLPRSMPILKELLQAMQQNPNLRIEIHGHVCCTLTHLDGRDNDLGTFDLSWQRAKVVYQYLIDNNISAERMSYKGFGASQKLFPLERDAYEMEENRRVEIKIVSK
jgi:outer membrane protein OmpA-like peptidoglycan-associated protein